MRLSVFIRILALLGVTVSGKIFHKNLIKNYMDYYHLSSGYLFYCDEYKGLSKLNFNVSLYLTRTIPGSEDWFKDFKYDSYYFSFIDLNSNKFREIDIIDLLRLQNRIIAIFVDVECNVTETLFEDVSENNFFNRSYNWLMIGSDFDSAFEVLQSQNINIDAEITLAIQNES